MKEQRRIQRKRLKGWRMPADTVSVTRPGKWGNPFTVGMWFKKLSPDWYVWTHGDPPYFGNTQVESLEHSLILFNEYARARARWDRNWLKPLYDKDLACWCKEGATCHADVLIQLIQEARAVETKSVRTAKAR